MWYYRLSFFCDSVCQLQFGKIDMTLQFDHNCHVALTTNLGVLTETQKKGMDATSGDAICKEIDVLYLLIMLTANLF